jgi:zinc transport system permease protein
MSLGQLLQYGFVERALVAGVAVSVVCALLGLFLVLRRLSLVGDGLSHVSFGAIALGLWLGYYPLLVAIPLVIAGALLILRLTERAKVYGEAAIGIVSAVSLAFGVILVSVSGGFNVDLFSYLFGNILSISTTEMAAVTILALLVVGVVIYLYHDLVAVAFNEELAWTTGVKNERVNVMLVVLAAVTVVLAVRVVGVMLISSLLILPAVSALQIARSFRGAIIWSVVLAVAALLVGVLVSLLLNLPTGATVVLVNFLWFVLALVYAKYFS